AIGEDVDLRGKKKRAWIRSVLTGHPSRRTRGSCVAGSRAVPVEDASTLAWRSQAGAPAGSYFEARKGMAQPGSPASRQEISESAGAFVLDALLQCRVASATLLRDLLERRRRLCMCSAAARRIGKLEPAGFDGILACRAGIQEEGRPKVTPIGAQIRDSCF